MTKKRSKDAPKQEVAVKPAPPVSYAGFWLLLGETLRQHYRTIGFILIAAFLSNALMLAQPLFVMTVYDRVIPHGAFETLWALAIGVLLAIALDFVIRGVRTRLENSVAVQISTGLQARLYRNLIYAKTQNAPTAMADWTNAFRDLDAGSVIAPTLIASLLVDLPFVIIVMILVYSMAQDVILAPMIGILFFAIWTMIGAMLMRKTGGEAAKSQNERTELLVESASLAKTAKTAGAQKQLFRRFKWLLAESVIPTYKLRRYTVLQPQLTHFSVQTVVVASVIIGVYKIDAGLMSVGALVATMLFVSRMLMPVGQLVTLIARASELSRPLGRAFELMQTPQEASLDTALERPVRAGKLTLTNVEFTFEQAPAPSLTGLNVTIEPGEKVALIGRSGCGKSTLLQTFLRIYDPTKGQYLIDDHDAHQYPPRLIREAITYMSQETELFEGSIIENLLVAKPDASPEAIERALILSGADHFIKRNPEGLSQNVGRRGARLSGGERQAIGLARSLLRPAIVLLLDEPTSSMDQTMEQQVIRGLNELEPETTLIVATHRSSVLSAVNRIIWMDGGKIIADGPRDAVLAKLQGKEAA